MRTAVLRPGRRLRQSALHSHVRMARVTAMRGMVLALVLALLAAGCGVTREDSSQERRLRMMIPNSPGGGYDLTGRAAAKVMEDEGLTSRFEITNVIGASGTVAMQRLMNEKGSNDLMILMGLGVVGATYTNKSKARVSRATPIASVVEEQEGILVPKDSPFRTVDDLISAWKKDPKSIRVGGGSAPGGPDHLFPMQLAQVVGIDPKDVNFITYDGGGPLTSALLGNKIDLGTSGLGEFSGQIEDGSLRVLAVSGDERLAGVDAPTLQESDINLVFTNWRGLLAPPGITDDEADELIDVVSKMRETPEWKAALKRNGWVDNFATGDDFGAFLKEQDERVASTLEELGLA